MVGPTTATTVHGGRNLAIKRAVVPLLVNTITHRARCSKHGDTADDAIVSSVLMVSSMLHAHG